MKTRRNVTIIKSASPVRVFGLLVNSGATPEEPGRNNFINLIHDFYAKQQARPLPDQANDKNDTNDNNQENVSAP